MLDPAVEPEVETPEIPDKLYFRIGEVSRLTGIKPYVLRFWESEFHGIGPKKSGKGHRLYRRKDVELVLQIKQLLYEKRFTIEGARKFLDGKPKAEIKQAAASRKSARSQSRLFEEPLPELDGIKHELRAILDMLK